MRRLRFLLAATFIVAPAIAGCDSGIKEGMEKDIPKGAGRPDMLQREMEKNAGKMKQATKRKPSPVKAAPASPAEEPK